MRILYVANTFFPSRAAHTVQITKMCEAFGKAKHFVTLLGFRKTRRVDIATSYGVGNFHEHLLPLWGTYTVREFRLFFQTIMLKKFDLVFTRSLLFAFLLLLVGSHKVFYELHEIQKNRFWRFVLKFVALRSKHIIVISEGLRDALVNEFGIPERYIFVHHDGVDLEHYSFSQNEAREKLSIDPDARIVLYSGSFKSWKGLDFLLDAFAASNPRRLRLYVVGGAPDEVDRYKVAHKHRRVTFVGHVAPKDVSTYILAADYLVLPNVAQHRTSSHYTSPLKLFEYMAAGKPILCSDLPSLRAVVNDTDVYYFDPKRQDELAKLLRLIDRQGQVDSDEETRVANCLRKVKQYTWQKRAKKVTAILTKRLN